MTAENKGGKIRACCDICVHYAYDDDAGEEICTLDLDEDEYERYLSGSYRSCPYYQPYDEYQIVRKQN